MNITKVAAWSEIVSSVAILATLAYLAVQTQQNTAAIQAQTRQAVLDADLAVLHMWSTNPQIALGLSGRGELNEAEQMAVYFAFGAFMRTRENHWLQYQNGVLDEATWKSYRNAIPFVLSTKRGRDYWAHAHGFDDGFMDEVNKLIDGEPTTELWDHALAWE